MAEEKKKDASHQVLSDMAENDAEQPGDTPSDVPINQSGVKEEQTEDAPRETD